MPRWPRFPRPLVMALAMLAAMTTVAILVQAIGIRMIGSIAAWQTWLHRHAWYFVIWRMAIYALIARGWWSMRNRVRRRDVSLDARRRLLHAEAMALLAIALTEGLAWLHPL
ncbi:putative membrane protein [Burkholderia thailandensis MSMB121]|nr:putative membrane protein [Burkholderia thailandensis MSMB121]ATF37237.1 hypothetical protein CO709_31105 [Burkholderia thailandensis]KST74613.1 hypothetical protein WS76_10890 [Burkholderia humptydooensis]